jgi:hypothetical protein
MNRKGLQRLNLLLFLEIVTLIGSTAYLAANWYNPVNVGLNAISLLWVEVLYLLYVNYKERE